MKSRTKLARELAEAGVPINQHGRRTHRSTRRPCADLADEPLLLLRCDFGSREWFDAACSVAPIRPRVLLESAAPHTLIALAATGYGIAIIPSNAQVPRGAVRVMPLIHRGASVGRWAMIAWDSQRFLAPYGEQFVAEIVAHCRRDYHGRDLIRRAPPLSRPKDMGRHSMAPPQSCTLSWG